MAQPIIEVKGLTHDYGDVKAVDDVSFRVKEGEVFSLLGPNGAGKTTIINVLITLLPAQTGEVQIAGFDRKRQEVEIRRNIGIVFQDEVLDRDMTVWEIMELHGRIHSMPAPLRKERIAELLNIVELSDRRNTLVKKLSGGMKRRLEIGRGLMTRPRVLFLDEPTIGLDPQTRIRLWEYIKKVNREGTTIFLTTHYMDEADGLSDTITIMDKGKIITQGTSASLKDALGKDVVYLETSDDKGARLRLKAVPGIQKVKRSKKGLMVYIQEEGSKFLPKLLKLLDREGIEIEKVSLKKPSLDDVFIHHTGRELRDEENAKGSRFPKKMRGK